MARVVRVAQGCQCNDGGEGVDRTTKILNLHRAFSNSWPDPSSIQDACEQMCT